MFVGIISDTHGVWDKEFRDFLSPVDEIWHAGDFGGGLEFADKIAAFKPIKGVCGNCDGADIRLEYPWYQFFEAGGCKVLMTHIGGYPGHYSPAAMQLIYQCKPDIFVCGHSHILKVMRDPARDMLCINPGACGIQGWHIERTALRLKIENGTPSDMELLRVPR